MSKNHKKLQKKLSVELFGQYSVKIEQTIDAIKNEPRFLNLQKNSLTNK